MDTTNIRKKIQYITVDSEFVQGGSNNVFSVNLGTINGSTTSNVLLQNMRNVIGLKLVDFLCSDLVLLTFQSVYHLLCSEAA